MFEKKRIIIFAHYDRDNVIDDYVIFYLKALKEIAQKIIFVSDGKLSFKEQKKIKNITDEIIAQPHEQYDFGSYKKGFLWALKEEILKDFDECIFVNDSCYGPFTSLKPIFDEMETQEFDFWSITQNEFGFILNDGEYIECKRPHLQSYFLVFRKNVFLSDCFLNFIKSIKKEKNKQDVIEKYEIGLTEKLIQEGFIKGSFIANIYPESKNLTIEKWDSLILDHKMPFLKCYLLKLKYKKKMNIDNYANIIKQISDYPVELIKKNVERTFFNKDLIRVCPKFLKIMSYKLYNLMRNLFSN